MKQTIIKFLSSFHFWRTFGLKKEIYFFIENLSALLAAGMDIPNSLTVIQEEITSTRLRHLVQGIAAQVAEGVSLSTAFAQAYIVPEHMLSLMRVGEETGRLVENLKVITLQNEKEQLFRSRIRSSLTYAIVVITLAIVVGVGIATFTLPRVADFFVQINAELPLVTRIIIAVGLFLGKYGYFLAPFFVVGLFIIFYFLFSFPRTKFIGHSLLFHTPVIKTLIKEAELARFGFLLGTMLEAGMIASHAVSNLPSTTTFRNYRQLYVFLQDSIEQGNSFRSSFAVYPKIEKIMPAAVRQMISAAEQSGTLSETCLRIGRLYETKVDATARLLPTIIEPVIIVFVGIMVAMLAVGTILPIYNLSSIL